MEVKKKDYAIDYVVPMVFPDDEEWRRDFIMYAYRYDEGDVRYRSWGTERTLVRLVKKNMPWIRTIYVILARESQKKAWMDEEGVRVVYHHEFIPEKFLPTFNSMTIEMFLKDIPGLSERFIYGNDDMFPLSPLKKTDFFYKGKPCIVMEQYHYPNNPNVFQMSCMSGLNFVGEEFGMVFSDVWYKNGHSIAPILKSTCEHLWEIGADRIEKASSRFRNVMNFSQYIYSWWHYLSGEYVERAPEHTYVSVTRPVVEIIDAIHKGGIVCVNDNEKLSDHSVYAVEVRKALEESLNKEV